MSGTDQRAGWSIFSIALSSVLKVSVIQPLEFMVMSHRKWALRNEKFRRLSLLSNKQFSVIQTV